MMHGAPPSRIQPPRNIAAAASHIEGSPARRRSRALPYISALAAGCGLSACATPLIETLTRDAPETLMASRPVLESSFCLIASLIESCPGGAGGEIRVAPNAAGVTPAIHMDAETGAMSASLSVMTWNVEGLPPPLSLDRWDALIAIGETLADMRARGEAPNVLLIQEGFMPDAMRQLIARSGYRYVARGPGANAPTPRQSGEMGAPWTLRGEGIGKMFDAGLYILSDYPILSVVMQPYAHCAGVDCLSNKGAMLARIQIPGAPAPIALLNTHMNSQNSTQTPKERAHLAHHHQMDALQTFVHEHWLSDEPLIFGGDFNMRGSTERWMHAAPGDPVTLVDHWCASAAPCRIDMPDDLHDPMTRQDLQGFHNGGGLSLQPERIALLYAPGSDLALSDHGAYLVDYRVTWNSPAAPARYASDLAEISGAANLFTGQPISLPQQP